MSEYRRNKQEGGVFFFTVVTFHRKPILTGERERCLLRAAWKDVEKRFPFKTIAVCLLSDHIHCLWQLPEGDADFSVRWKEIKRLFTKSYLAQIGPGGKRNDSRIKQQEAAIWQRRFWEHTIRDEQDLNHHIHYIHYNPVKHGYVQSVRDWPWSSFHRYVREGLYEADWGTGVEETLFVSDYGE
ncbi:MAG: transposase [Anaerolineaceae bacterium]|jgi:putative transposase|nr:transposase [Anaerolineaceae bacterium]